MHPNLGDQAQVYCIRKWLKENYPNTDIIEVKTKVVIDKRYGFIDELKKRIGKNDLIVFQSGYCTQDLGGYNDLMHRIMMENFPNTKMLLLPQTVNFVNKDREALTSKIYNNHKLTTFLARDRVSFEKAKKMFPDINVMLYPDIVTSLIGKYEFNYERKGILFCCRNDSEQYYTNEQINTLRKNIEKYEHTELTDTTRNIKYSDIKKNLKGILEKTFDEFAHYKIIITDRYHGTIFSLISNTPVIVIKTTDHKVATGVDWFKGVYDDNVYFAESLEKVEELVQEILKKKLSSKLDNYFEREYYKKLKEKL